jgi:menaquinone-dependent protoporphyrinogen oxidase
VIVLGSAVYMGSWLYPAKRFVATHGARISQLPAWLFRSGPIGDPPHPAGEHAVQVDEILTATGAREPRVFAGRLDEHLLGVGERAVLVVRAEEGDFRDWGAVAGWSRRIADSLREGGQDR